MAVTRSSVESRGSELRRPVPAERLTWRGQELAWLSLAALIVCGVWALVYTAKVRRSTTPAPTVNLTDIDSSEKLFPVLAVLQSPADRDFAAKLIFDTLADHNWMCSGAIFCCGRGPFWRLFC
jgi:hypothetical protein